MPPTKGTSKRATRAKMPWEKMKAITRVRAGESKAAVARSIDVPESTLRGWCKNAEKIESTTRQTSTSPPTSGDSTGPSEGGKKATLDGNASPQNVSGLPPPPPEEHFNYEGIIDLSLPSPQASSSARVESRMLQQAQDFTAMCQAAHLNQVVQALRQAQDLSLNLATTASGAATLPNSRMHPNESVRQWLNMPSQISPISSGATLSTPQHNGQHTTSPIAGNTPDQPHMYLEWCRALMMSRLGGMPMPPTYVPAGMPSLYHQVLPNNSATESYPATPRQPIGAQMSPNQPREEIEVPEMNCGSSMSPEAMQEYQSLAVDLRSPQARSRRLQSAIREASDQLANTTDQAPIADQSSSMPLQSENSTNETADIKPPVRKRKCASLENIVSELRESAEEGAVVKCEQDQGAPDLQECIAIGENFLSALQKNLHHPSITAFHVKQVKSFINNYTAALGISPQKKRKLE
ncbi:uncharacterized protein LOC123675566 [Harmonia axyridis]|uniref:uncharacterized protein LOC123675566 n=1 Tax=Harmonia axyridis TaxID=115357 RepID=UPI001E275EBF|nr:uncharacterized protein LOC123675566 [Harmonia axyridis]